MKKREEEGGIRICIDRGGTFTDIYAESDGEAHHLKLLSVDPNKYEDAPIEGIRRILQLFTNTVIPPSSPLPTSSIHSIRMGTTLATNALLQRKGCPLALCVTKGFRDLLLIGDQSRPHIFDLTASTLPLLYHHVLEVHERVLLHNFHFFPSHSSFHHSHPPSRLSADDITVDHDPTAISTALPSQISQVSRPSADEIRVRHDPTAISIPLSSQISQPSGEEIRVLDYPTASSALSSEISQASGEEISFKNQPHSSFDGSRVLDDSEASCRRSSSVLGVSGDEIRVGDDPTAISNALSSLNRGASGEKIRVEDYPTALSSSILQASGEEISFKNESTVLSTPSSSILGVSGDKIRAEDDITALSSPPSSILEVSGEKISFEKDSAASAASSSSIRGIYGEKIRVEDYPSASSSQSSSILQVSGEKISFKKEPAASSASILGVSGEKIKMEDDITSSSSQCSSIVGVSGEKIRVCRVLEEEALKPMLEGLLKKGIKSLAVVLMHSYTYPNHELAIQRLALSMGFTHVSLSSSVAPTIRAVPRGMTATVDAYLTPVVKEYLAGFMSRFDPNDRPVDVMFMQSDGGLVPESAFSGHRAVLSGPAGGVVGYSKTLFGVETEKPLIGFDMGGTSTDVSRYAGALEHVLETRVSGVAIRSPQIDIRTVAAGGGSRLRFLLGSFRVGPDSVGAHPGPVCYRKGGELSVTDANLVLGFIVPEYFPRIFGPLEDQPLDVAAAREAFGRLAEEVNLHRKASGSGSVFSVEEVARGFVDVANETMCRPIRQSTEMRGHETGDHALACFGGAGPQHACAIARTLGMREVFVHRLCGILSAYGMGLADVVEEAQEPYSAVYGPASAAETARREAGLLSRVTRKLRDRGFGDGNILTHCYLNMRYEGTDTPIMVEKKREMGFDFAEEFERLFQIEYGFRLLDRRVLICDVRVRGAGRSAGLRSPVLEPVSSPPVSEGKHPVYFTNRWLDTPVYLLDRLGRGHALDGPAIIMNGTSTVVVEPGCRASITRFGNIRIEIRPGQGYGEEGGPVDPAGDVIRLSIFNHRFMGIAEQMGQTLQRTAVSTNIKERLDFSCALFGPDGGLVANAPHVPVHLGAMSSTVRWQADHWRGDLSEGDVLLTNHPSTGGSHLPDMTVITPVFDGGRVVFFVASRGHHAEIGGLTPGSMPPFSTSLSQEGAAIKAFKLLEKGVFREEEIVRILTAAGTRRIRDNLSDLRAQVAANRRGIALIGDLIAQYGLGTVQEYMNHVRKNAEFAVREMLKSVAGGGEFVAEEEDYMDDGSAIRLRLKIDGEKGEAEFDFSGTTAEVYGNWNSPEAVTVAAVIYCIRCMVDVEIPLNQGCLAPVRVRIPAGSFLSPGEEAAVVGGNVLTSQRVTDVVLSAFRACACSQGCMNNLTFGDESFGYYETIGGGSGAGPTWDGTSGVQCHMTNTRITDPEVLEQRYPVILKRFQVRDGSGGRGQRRGGDGIVRELQFRRPVLVSILSERRVFRPRGMRGGDFGARGENYVIRDEGRGRKVYLGGKNTVQVQQGDVILILTPGGGGWGAPEAATP